MFHMNFITCDDRDPPRINKSKTSNSRKNETYNRNICNSKNS